MTWRNDMTVTVFVRVCPPDVDTTVQKVFLAFHFFPRFMPDWGGLDWRS